MVTTRPQNIYTNNIFYQWSDIADFQFRGDAEYWLPSHKILESDKFVPLKNIASIDGGKRLPIGETFTSKGIPYVRAVDLDGFFINFDDIKYIGEPLHNILKKYQIVIEDILITIVGVNIGRTGLLDRELDRCNFTENCARIRINKNINPYYLILFLNTKYGKQQVTQNAVGGAQPKLPLYVVNNLKIYIPSKTDQDKTVKSVKEIYSLWNEAKNLYYEAKNRLNEELGLNELNLQIQTTFWYWNDEIDIITRLDPNYHRLENPKIKEVLRGNSFEIKYLGELVDIKKGIEVGHTEYINTGIPFIRVGNLTEEGIDLTNCNFIRPLLFEELKKEYEVKKDDILFSKDGTVGITYLFNESFNCITSGGILRLNVKDETAIDKYYLTLVLNSLIAKVQIEKGLSGAVIQHFNIEKVKNIKIPILKSQTEISKLIQSSFEKRKQSYQKLEKAKKYVEELAEKEIKN